MDQNFLMNFLETLERLVPPVEKGLHHGIQRFLYGSDEVGWIPKLGVEVRTPYFIQVFFFDEHDFDKTPDFLADEIANIFSENASNRDGTPQPTANLI